MGIFSGKKKEKKEGITFTNVTSSGQVGGRTGKQAPQGKNLISKSSARYARARVKDY